MASTHLLSVSTLSAVIVQGRTVFAAVGRLAGAELRRRHAAAALEELSPRQRQDVGLPPLEPGAGRRGTVLVDGSTMRRLRSLY